MRMVLYAISVLFETPTDWESCKAKLLSDIDFIEKLLNYNVEGKKHLFY